MPPTFEITIYSEETLSNIISPPETVLTVLKLRLRNKNANFKRLGEKIILYGDLKENEVEEAMHSAKNNVAKGWGYNINYKIELIPDEVQ